MIYNVPFSKLVFEDYLNIIKYFCNNTTTNSVCAKLLVETPSSSIKV